MFNTVLTTLESSTPSIDWGTINIQPIVDAISDAVPAILPAIIGIAGIRKAVSFVVGMIRSA